MSHISPVLWQFLVKWLTNFSLYPPQASKIAPQMDALYFFMVLVSLIGLTIVILLVTAFSIMYRQKKGCFEETGVGFSRCRHGPRRCNGGNGVSGSEQQPG